MGALLGACQLSFGFLVVDCPPLSPVADAVALQDLLDGFLLVVRARTAPRDVITRAVGRLKEGRIHGVVFNSQPEVLPGGYGPSFQYVLRLEEGLRARTWARARAASPSSPSRSSCSGRSSSPGSMRFGAELWSYPLLLPKALLCVAVLQLSLFYSELYELRSRRRTELFLRVGQSLAVGAVALAVIFFVLPALRGGPRRLRPLRPHRRSGAPGLALRPGVSPGKRSTSGSACSSSGPGCSAQKVARAMLRQSPLGYRVLGFLTEHPEEVGKTLVNPSIVGTLDDLPRLLEELAGHADRGGPGGPAPAPARWTRSCAAGWTGSGWWRPPPSSSP